MKKGKEIYSLSHARKYNTLKLIQLSFFATLFLMLVVLIAFLETVFFGGEVLLAPGNPVAFVFYPVTDIDTCALGETKFAITWCGDAGADCGLSVYETNGTLLAQTMLLQNLPSYSRTAISCVNETAIFTGRINSFSDSTTWRVEAGLYSFSGNALTLTSGWLNIDGGVGNFTPNNGPDISVDIFNLSYGVVGYVDDSSNDFIYAIINFSDFSSNGNVAADLNVSPDSPLENRVDVCAFSNSRAVGCWFDEDSTADDFGAVVFNEQGAATVGPYFADDAVGDNAAVSCSCLNNNRVAFGYFDDVNDSILVSVHDYTGDINSIFKDKMLLQGADILDEKVSTAGIFADSESYFGVAYSRSTTPRRVEVGIFDENADNIVNITTNNPQHDNENYRVVDIMGADFNSNISLCEGKFVVAYASSDGNSYFEAFDVQGTSWDGNCTMQMQLPDTTFPLIDYGVGTENDNAFVARNNIYVNVSVTETNFANITFSLRNDTAIVNETTFITLTLRMNWTNLAFSNYSYNVSLYDQAGNFNSTQTRIINLSASVSSVDLTPPVVNVRFPVQGAFYHQNNLPLKFNVSLNENGSVQYSLNGGINNITMTGNEGSFGTEFSAQNTSISDGNYTFRVYVNDTSGNRNDTSFAAFTFLFNDSMPPVISVHFPRNTTYNRNSLPLNFNVSLNENGSVQYSLDGGVANITMTGSEGNVFGTNFNKTNGSIADGGYTFSAYANDTSGNRNTTQIQFSFIFNTSSNQNSNNVNSGQTAGGNQSNNSSPGGQLNVQTPPPPERVFVSETALFVSVTNGEEIILDLGNGQEYRATVSLGQDNVKILVAGTEYIIGLKEVVEISVGGRQVYVGIQDFELGSATLAFGYVKKNVEDEVLKSSFANVKQTVAYMLISLFVLLFLVALFLILYYYHKKRAYRKLAAPSPRIIGINKNFLPPDKAIVPGGGIRYGNAGDKTFSKDNFDTGSGDARF